MHIRESGHITTQTNNMATLQIMRLSADAVLPSKAHSNDAGYDLSSTNEYIIEPMGFALVETGIAIRVPHGTYGRIAPRSGLSCKSIFINAGVVDQSYRGPVKVVVYNLGKEPFKVEKGMRIAQLILEKIMLVSVVEVPNLEETSRGTSGFGSSGI